MKLLACYRTTVRDGSRELHGDCIVTVCAFELTEAVVAKVRELIAENLREAGCVASDAVIFTNLIELTEER